MKLHIFLALLVASAAVAAQTLDSTMEQQPAEPQPDAATQPSEASPPDTSDAVPMSAFEAIQAPPAAGLSPTQPATPAPPLRLQLDANLKHIGPYTPPPPVAPRIPGKELPAPRSPAPSDWR